MPNRDITTTPASDSYSGPTRTSAGGSSPIGPWCSGRPFLEVPLSSIRILGLDVPIAGGNYFRQFPQSLVRRAVAYWDRHYPSPYVMYFHTWELDPDQPRVNGVPCSQQVRQYRNLSKMPSLVRDYLRTYRFTSIASYFQLEQPELRTEARGAPAPSAPGLRARARRHSHVTQPVTAVTVVVPCYNEQQSLPYLANTLRSFVAEWAQPLPVQLRVCR